ncbi:DUF2255 family protein [Luteipulveratus flavus]|uniref:DUF2255 family protein n=1 Tax=Luteipulveratus flavus TaxID=3031728 RepID=A0ABT6C7Q7_9MICO|nr:DUF2255 family protein [Luteipulveratus sp. YIM 133296]MDF8264741.1 DUF2255 family protein [Luteipulveratus sp. YIM 133296]
MSAPTSWTAEELATIDRVDEVEVATRRRDGSLRSDRIVWIVRHGDAVYVRSVNGVSAAWYRGVQTAHRGHLTAGGLRRDIVFVEAGDHAGDAGDLDDAIDAAYRAKYGQWSGPVARITDPDARATTLRLDPA